MSELIEIGTEVRVYNQPGTYKVMSYNSDGSYCVYGGTFTHRSYRDFQPGVVRLAKKTKESKR